MNQRRKFLLNGSMAAIGLLAIDPFKGFASSINNITESSFASGHTIVLTHTGTGFAMGNPKVKQGFEKLNLKHSNILVLNVDQKSVSNKFDIPFKQVDVNSVADNYQIILHGKIKVGIISSDENQNFIKEVNNLAAFLKNEKHCDLVVCISTLGYRTDDKIDDLNLAKSSTHIDMIVGDHSNNYCKQPFISHNKNKEEVIINYTGENGLAYNSIEIGFDNSGRKNLTKFIRLS